MLASGEVASCTVTNCFDLTENGTCDGEDTDDDDDGVPDASDNCPLIAYVNQCTTPVPMPVPTLPKWGLFIMVLALPLIASAGWFIRKQNRRSRVLVL